MFVGENRSVSITASEARKILGGSGKALEDDQIIEIIGTLSLMAKKESLRLGSKKTLGKDRV